MNLLQGGGYGDELMGSGIARGVRSVGKRIAFGDGQRIIWTDAAAEVFQDNPNVAPPGDEGAADLHWVTHYMGRRAYIKRQTADKFIWDFRFHATPGEFYFNQAERALAASFAPGFVVIEPNVKWHQALAPNKDWGESRYQELARRLLLHGHRLVQFRHQHTRRIIADADVIELPKFRQAAAVLSRAAVYIGPDGGMHHAAAAVGVPAVVLFGGYAPPDVTGYDSAINLTGGAIPCGNIFPCKHCRQAMANISVDTVREAVARQLRQIDARRTA